MAERFGRNAQAIERTDGLRGLVLLDRLDLEAIFLYEKHPNEFRRLRDLLGGDAAADLLLHWREYFGLKRADDTDRAHPDRRDRQVDVPPSNGSPRVIPASSR